MNIVLKVRSDTVTPALNKLSLVLAEKRRLHRAIGEKFLEMSKRNFGVSGQYRSQGWRPLTKKYQKRIRYYGPPKLVLKGNLRSSIRLSVTTSEATVYSDSPYAAVHQFGGGNNIPARPYFPVIGSDGNYRLTKRAEFEIQNALQAELNRII